MPKIALICGISGQDGAYLAQHLLGKGYQVWGSSRDAQKASFENLKNLGIFDAVQLVSLDPKDSIAVTATLKQVRPDHLYSLSGQTSVGVSFDQPRETMESIAIGTLNILESVRLSGLNVRIYNAGSVETFGDTGDSVATEQTPLNLCSPYAIAKASAYWTVATYRKAYGMFACTGILSNHESPLRPPIFVTRKVINAVAQIALGVEVKLSLGNLDVERDWGWAPEFVDASVRMMEHNTPADYIIATGETCSLLDFVKAAFALAGLDWQDHVIIDEQLKRPTDIARIRLDPSKAAAELGWRANSRMRDVVRMMLQAEMALSERDVRDVRTFHTTS